MTRFICRISRGLWQHQKSHIFRQNQTHAVSIICIFDLYRHLILRPINARYHQNMLKADADLCHFWNLWKRSKLIKLEIPTNRPHYGWRLLKSSWPFQAFIIRISINRGFIAPLNLFTCRNDLAIFTFCWKQIVAHHDSHYKNIPTISQYLDPLNWKTLWEVETLDQSAVYGQ